MTPEPVESDAPETSDSSQTETDTTYAAPSAQNTTVVQQPAAQTETPQTETPQATAAPVQTDGGADSGEGCIDDGLTW